MLIEPFLPQTSSPCPQPIRETQGSPYPGEKNPGYHDDPGGNTNTLLTQPPSWRHHELRAYHQENSQLLLPLSKRTEEVASIFEKREIFSFRAIRITSRRSYGSGGWTILGNKMQAREWYTNEVTVYLTGSRQAERRVWVLYKKTKYLKSKLLLIRPQWRDFQQEAGTQIATGLQGDAPRGGGGGGRAVPLTGPCLGLLRMSSVARSQIHQESSEREMVTGAGCCMGASLGNKGEKWKIGDRRNP